MCKIKIIFWHNNNMHVYSVDMTFMLVTGNTDSYYNLFDLKSHMLWLIYMVMLIMVWDEYCFPKCKMNTISTIHALYENHFEKVFCSFELLITFKWILASCHVHASRIKVCDYTHAIFDKIGVVKLVNEYISR